MDSIRPPTLSENTASAPIPGSQSVAVVGTTHIPTAAPASSSSEQKSVKDRSAMEVKEISASEFKVLILKQTFRNDVHYKVKGDLFLSNCINLTVLPENFSVEGNFYLHHCDNLTTLPENFSVSNILSFNHCSALTTLSENLSVGGDFILIHCLALTTLPENLTLGGELIIMNCPDLTALPNWITRLGSTEQGTTRAVILQSTGLSVSLIERLRVEDAPDMQFFFSLSAGQPDQHFSSMEQAFDFWRKLASSSAEISEPLLGSDQASTLKKFLERLTGTADYENKASRPVLAQRVINVIALLGEDNQIREEAMRRINDAMSSCDDRVTLALDDLETLRALISAENMAAENNDPRELRTLGLQMMRLDEVKKIAQDHMKTLSWVDEIEVELAFQIGVRKQLELPGSTQYMLFREYAHVSDQHIDKAVEQIKENCSEDKLDAYLVQWAPWQKYQRKMTIPTFDQLNTKTEPHIKECCIAAIKTEKMATLTELNVNRVSNIMSARTSIRKCSWPDCSAGEI